MLYFFLFLKLVLILLIIVFIVSILLVNIRINLKYWFWKYIHHSWEEYFETSSAAIRDIWKYLSMHNLGESIFYDLGSSRGNVLLGLSYLCPKMKMIWIENDNFKIFCARFEKLFHYNSYWKITFRKADFFTADIYHAQVLFAYVPRILLKDLAEKFKRELKENTVIITYRIDFPDWKPLEVIETDIVDWISHNKIFIYKNSNWGFL